MTLSVIQLHKKTGATDTKQLQSGQLSHVGFFHMILLKIFGKA